MSAQRPWLKVLIANAIAAIITILVFGLTASDAKTLQPSPFLSPTGSTLQTWLPIVMNNFPPSSTISRYVGYADLVNWTAMHDLGCNRGQAVSTGQNVIVIIDFGYPAYDSASAQYGAKSLNDYIFHSTADIVNATEGFLGGFYYCSPTGISLTLAIGVSNYPLDSNSFTQQHGVAWAQAVTALNTWISNPPSFADKLTAWGAIDAEIMWNTITATKAWVNGYKLSYNPYVDFGSCDGCPYFAHPDWIPKWSFDDIWYVAYGGAPLAYPLPEIYTVDGGNADQWYRMSLYAYTHHNGVAMRFKGSMTEWNACQEQTDPNYCSSRGIDNTPSQGYMQLYNAINADPHTAQSMPWSTDISWKK